jgi:hypothetical protein
MVFTASTSFDQNGKLTVMPADMRDLPRDAPYSGFARIL